jgi:endonuclease-3 related protein
MSRKDPDPAGIYRRMLGRYGPQHWWPAETPFEVMVGAVLTQNTAWGNVERAITNLKRAGLLDARAIRDCPRTALARHLRPSGYFNVKARRLTDFCDWYLRRDGFEGLDELSTVALRDALLSVRGIGPETADDVLLYAFGRPVFVIDAYTRRIFSRLGMVSGDEPYERLRGWFEDALPPDPTIYNEYHALIVRHGKDVCRTRPACGRCVLKSICPGVVSRAA